MEDDLFIKLQLVANRESGIDKEIKYRNHNNFEETFKSLVDVLEELKINQTKRYCEYCGKRLQKRSGPLWHVKCVTGNNVDGKFDTITGERYIFND